MTTETRTNEELTRIIAVWGGLTKCECRDDCKYWVKDGGNALVFVDYCEDLNALNTAIYSNYSEDIADFYAMRLWEIVNPDVGLETCSSTELLAFCNANARDRAEALVRVIELNKPTTT